MKFVSQHILHTILLSLSRQGSRTPHTDPLARGAFVGLSLAHTRAHIFRAILESVCYGTRACFDALESAAQQNIPDEAMMKSNEVIIAGGKLQCNHRILLSFTIYHSFVPTY